MRRSGRIERLAQECRHRSLQGLAKIQQFKVYMDSMKRKRSQPLLPSNNRLIPNVLREQTEQFRE
jgi:hypothetical protein